MRTTCLIILFAFLVSTGCTKSSDPAVAPTITTTAASEVTSTSAKAGGDITTDGGSAITARGVCWSTSHKPTVDLNTKTSDGGSSGSFSSAISGLTVWTTYYVRAYATNSAGTGYGAEIQIVTIPPLVKGTVTDIDGNSYSTVIIGTKTWMAENLHTKRYRDGSSLGTGSGSTGNYAVFGGNTALIGDYGYLYDAPAVTDVRKLCPTGWHVPSTSEWNEVANLLGGTDQAGARMKDTRTGAWAIPNTGATNASGFTGRGGGSIHNGNFVDFGTDGYWWAAEPPTFFYLTNDLIELRTKSTAATSEGLSIRCVRD